MQIPRHLAIIMDGNGRWAQQRGLPRLAGHRQGVGTARQIVQECRALGVEYLTLFAFSSENWRRPKTEIQALMGLLTTFLRQEMASLAANGIRLQVIGELERLAPEVRRILLETLEQTRGNKGMVLTLALSYGARNELVRTARALAEEVRQGRLQPEQIDEAALEARLDTAGLPDPDFLIRTSGEMRISNFLLWQIAYTELYFTPALWPDFDRRELRKALAEFARRERRFGQVGDQVAGGGEGERKRKEGHH